MVGRHEHKAPASLAPAKRLVTLPVHQYTSAATLSVLRPEADRSSFFDASQHQSGVGGQGWCARDREAKKVWPKKNNPGLTETRTRIVGFKVQSANHYTIRPWKKQRYFAETLLLHCTGVAHSASSQERRAQPELAGAGAGAGAGARAGAGALGRAGEPELELGPKPSAEPKSRRAGEPESRRAGG